MTALAVPDVRLHESWAATVLDFGDGYPHGSGFDPAVPYDLTAAGCAAFVAEKLRFADPDAVLPGDRVHCSYFWVVDDTGAHDDDPVIGFLAVRHRLNDWLLDEGGHIGYSVRPSRRGLGHASRALRLGLDHAAGLGIDRALLTCDDDNLASRRTIVSGGGIYEDTRNGKQRFWIATGGDGLSTGRAGAAEAGPAPR